MVYEKPEPLTDTRYVHEIPERIGYDGAIIEAIDEVAARTAIEALVADGVEALTVCFLNAHANGRHERVVAEIAARVAPNLPVSISSEILPEFREYERTVTTVVNAYVAPALSSYLGNVRDGLAAAKVRAPIQVVRSDGGLMSLEAAVDESRAHGALGPRRRCQRRVVRRIARRVRPDPDLRHGRHLDRRRGLHRRATRDHARDARRRLPRARTRGRRGQYRRRRRLDRLHRRGHRRAARRARERGRRSPALPVTDAAARRRPSPTRTSCSATFPPRLLGGAMELDVGSATAAVQGVADTRGAGLHETARAIVDMVNETMLGALRVVTVQRGREPSRVRARRLRWRRRPARERARASCSARYPLIVPEESGVLSALGFVASEIKNEFSQTFMRSIASATPDEIRVPFEALSRTRPRVARSRARRRRRPGRALHPRHALRPAGLRDPRRARRRRARGARPACARTLLRRSPPSALRLRARGWCGDREPARRRDRTRTLPEVAAREEGAADASSAQTGTQPVWTPAGVVDMPNYERTALAPGMAVRRVRDRRAVRRDDGRPARPPRRRRPLDEPPDLARGARGMTNTTTEADPQCSTSSRTRS